MTIQFLAANIITGLSTDTKPILVPVNSMFFETDRRRWFRFDGTDYLETGTPRADDEIFAYEQQDIEDALGTDLEIPDGESRSITVKTPTLVINKPIKIGAGSSFFLSSDTVLRTIVYTGPGAFIQEITPGSGTGNIVLNQIIIAGITTNEFIDVTVATGNLVQISNSFIVNFDLGKVKGGLFTTFAVTFIDYGIGLICEDNILVFFNSGDFVKSTGANSTAITIKTAVDGNYDVSKIDGTFPADNFLIFFDPNSTATSRLIVSDCVTPTNQLFQPGAIQVNSAVIGTSGAGFTNFTTATSHGLVVGQEIVNSTFADSAYNGTFIVISVDTPLTGTIYEVEATFTATGTGQLFHQNADITINSVADNGSGNTRFTTAGAHGLVVSQAVVIKDFVTQTTYNQTAIVTAVDTAKTGVTFDADIVFVATDTGTINAASLDETDVKVSARDNPNNAASTTIGILDIVDNTNAFEPGTTFGDFDFGVGGSKAGSSIERWEVINEQTGEVRYIGLEPFKGMLLLVFTFSPASVRSYNIGFLKNGTLLPQTSGLIPMQNQNTQITLSADISAVTNDTFKPQILVSTGGTDVIIIQGNYTIE